jgi:midasin
MSRLHVLGQAVVPGWQPTPSPPGAAVVCTTKRFGVAPFFVPIGDTAMQQEVKYSMQGPTTSRNLLRLLRALQIRKPLLLEGSPGVGKTSIVEALAAATGHRVVRINLSEQTDMMDLLGSDMPIEGGKAGQFAWSDGVLLQAGTLSFFSSCSDGVLTSL